MKAIKQLFLFFCLVIVALPAKSGQVNGVSVSGSGGMVSLAWDGDSNTSYFIYISADSFSSTHSMEANKTVVGTETKIAGFEVGKSYYIAVTNALNSNVAPTQFVVSEDTQGPEVRSVVVNGGALTESVTIGYGDSIAVDFRDDSGVSEVNVLINQKKVDLSVSGNVATGKISVAATEDLSEIAIIAADSLGNVSQTEYSVAGFQYPESTVELIKPVSDFTTAMQDLEVIFTTSNAELYRLSHNNIYLDGWKSISGDVREYVALRPGNNTIWVEVKSYGSELTIRSNTFNVVYEEDAPIPPAVVKGASIKTGAAVINWHGGNTDSVEIFRKSAADTRYTRLTSIANENRYIDHTPEDGEYLYKIRSVEGQRVSEFSEIVSVITDSQGPEVSGFSILSDNAIASKIGPGKVEFSLELSEKVTNKPYLAFASSGMAPVIATLTESASSDRLYEGEFVVTSDIVTSGNLYPIFSAVDNAGNLGNSINIDPLVVDVDAPVVARNGAIGLFDNSPDTSAHLFEYDIELVDSSSLMGEVNARLIDVSSNAVVPGSETNLPLDGRASAQYSFNLPSDLGETVKNLRLVVDVADVLGNAVTDLQVADIQVYQGDIPPPSVPQLITVKAKPAGAIELIWSAVDGATSYEVYVGDSIENLELEKSKITLPKYSFNKESGQYVVGIKSVREHAGKTVTSALSELKTIAAFDAQPLAPENVAITTRDAHVHLTWDAVVELKYVVRRSASADFLDSVVVEETGHNQFIDYSSIASGHYWLAAKDKAGNLSEWVHIQELDLAISPLNQIVIERKETGEAYLRWQYDQPATFNVYRIVGGSASLVVEGLASKEYVDASLIADAITDQSVSYQVKPVVNGTEGVGVIQALLPLSISVEAGKNIKRGVLNSIPVQISNHGNEDVKSAKIHARYNIGSEIVEVSQQLSDITPGVGNYFDLVIPGRSGLDSELQLVLELEQAIVTSQKSSTSKILSLDVVDEAYELTLNYDQIRRGDLTKLSAQFKNNGDVPVELLWAKQHQTNYIPSDNIFVVVKDAQGNVLDRQYVKLTSGSGLVHANQRVVSQVAVGASVVIDGIPVNIAQNWPEDIELELHIDSVDYHIDNSVQSMAGPVARVSGALSEAPYSAVIDSVTPSTVYANGREETLVSGRVLSVNQKAYQPVQLVLSINGFERKVLVNSDAEGNFSYRYKPGKSELGLHKISAVYPDLTARPASAYINVVGAGVSPDNVNVVIPRNLKKEIKLRVSASLTQQLTNIKAEVDGASDIYVESDTLAQISPGSSGLLTVRLASNSNGNGQLRLRISSDEFDQALGYTTVQYLVTDSVPAITSTPSFINSGVKSGSSVQDQAIITNTGLVDLVGAEFSLQQLVDGQWVSAPGWLNIVGDVALERLAVGESYTVAMLATPSAGVAISDYRFRLVVSGENMQTFALNIFHKVTSDEAGAISFSISDNYTGTQDAQGNTYGGVDSASIKIQNSDVLSELYEKVTDSDGQVTFSDIPAGEYYYEVTAFDHQKISGQFQVHPGITNAMNLLIPVTTVKVSLDVVETTITDEYKLALTNTFETDVPAAIVTFDPTTVELPEMKKGEVHTGELVMTNHGLLKAYGLTPNLPGSNEYARFEFLNDFPDTLDPGESVAIAYKVIALRDFDQAGKSEATGAGETLLDIADISVEGFYYCYTGVVLFVSPNCIFIISTNTLISNFGVIDVEEIGVSRGAAATISSNGGGGGVLSTPDGGGGSSSVTYGNSSGGSFSGGAAGVQTLADLMEVFGQALFGDTDEYYEEPDRRVSIDVGGNTLIGCRKLNKQGISATVDAAFTGCE